MLSFRRRFQCFIGREIEFRVDDFTVLVQYRLFRLVVSSFLGHWRSPVCRAIIFAPRRIRQLHDLRFGVRVESLPDSFQRRLFRLFELWRPFFRGFRLVVFVFVVFIVLRWSLFFRLTIRIRLRSLFRLFIVVFVVSANAAAFYRIGRRLIYNIRLTFFKLIKIFFSPYFISYNQSLVAYFLPPSWDYFRLDFDRHYLVACQ